MVAVEGGDPLQSAQVMSSTSTREGIFPQDESGKSATEEIGLGVEVEAVGKMQLCIGLIGRRKNTGTRYDLVRVYGHLPLRTEYTYGIAATGHENNTAAGKKYKMDKAVTVRTSAGNATVVGPFQASYA